MINMKTQLSIKQNSIFFFIGMLLMATIFFVSGFVQPGEHVASNTAIENAHSGNKWEYKVIYVVPKSEKRLNTELSEFNWEFLGTTNEYALFRRAIPSNHEGTR